MGFEREIRLNYSHLKTLNCKQPTLYENTHLKTCTPAIVLAHRWFSGRMLACHAGGPGSIPGRCNYLLPISTVNYCSTPGPTVLEQVGHELQKVRAGTYRSSDLNYEQDTCNKQTMRERAHRFFLGVTNSALQSP